MQHGLINVAPHTLHYRVANRHGRFVQIGRVPEIDNPRVPGGVYIAPLLYSNVGLVYARDHACLENDALSEFGPVEKRLLDAALIDSPFDLTPVYLICQMFDHRRGLGRFELVDIYRGETNDGEPIPSNFIEPTARSEYSEDLAMLMSPLVRRWDTNKGKPAHLHNEVAA